MRSSLSSLYLEGIIFGADLMEGGGGCDGGFKRCSNVASVTVPHRASAFAFRDRRHARRRARNRRVLAWFMTWCRINMQFHTLASCRLSMLFVRPLDCCCCEVILTTDHLQMASNDRQTIAEAAKIFTPLQNVDMQHKFWNLWTLGSRYFCNVLDCGWNQAWCD